MGILNVTPDSFSDGGAYATDDAAVDAGLALARAGAAIVDVGGESTRPGAADVPAEVEAERVVPVVERLAAAGIAVSVDTTKAAVARAALDAGATMVNDVTALRGDPDLAGVVADAGAALCLMHMQGTPRTMQLDPRYDDVVAEVAAFLEERLAVAVEAGVAESLVCLDPGFGFGKTPDQNLALVRGLGAIVALGRPVLVGLSRKSTLARITHGPGAKVASDAASVAAAVAAFNRGASLFRVHAVAEHVDALAVAAALERGRVEP